MCRNTYFPCVFISLHKCQLCDTGLEFDCNQEATLVRGVRLAIVVKWKSMRSNETGYRYFSFLDYHDNPVIFHKQ